MKVTAMQTDITFSLSQLIWICGGIMAIVAFLTWAMKPIRKLDDHELRIKSLENAAKEQKKTDKYITSALNAIVNHMIDGNGIEELKKVRNEFQNEIINH